MIDLKSLACLSDKHEYFTSSFAGGTGCQCTCHQISPSDDKSDKFSQYTSPKGLENKSDKSSIFG